MAVVMDELIRFDEIVKKIDKMNNRKMEFYHV